MVSIMCDAGPVRQRLRRPLRWMAGAMLVAVSACSNGPALKKAPPSPQKAAPVTQAAPLVEATPEAGPPQNRVALLVPMTGANAAVGQSIANAANLALLDTNASRIRLQVYDTASGAAGAAARAIADGNKVFLGPLLAADVRAVASQAKAADVPILSFSNDDTLAEDGGAYVMGFQPGQSIARTVAFARGKGVTSFAALVPVGAYGQRASAAFMKAVQGSGGKVTAIETFPRDRAKLAAAVRRVTGYEARVARAAQAGMVRPDGTVAPVQQRLGAVTFQALLIADSGQVASALTPALTQYGAGPGQVRLLGPELWNSEPGVARNPALKGAWFASVPDERFRALSARYRARFGGSPSRLASLGYDAVLLVNSLGAKWEIGAPFPRSALDDRDGFAGIDGIFRFRGGVAERGLAVQQVGAGSFLTVSAASGGVPLDALRHPGEIV